MNANQVPVIDPGNSFIGPDYPGQMALGQLDTPTGQRLAMTLRVGPCTLTVLLPKQAAKQWAAQINAAADNMSGLIVPNGAVNLPKEPGDG